MKTPSVPHLAIPKKLADQKRAERLRRTHPTCPVCKQACRNDDFRCSDCESAVVVGELVSEGTGSIPHGHAFALRGRDYVIGRSLNSDYVVPDEELPNEILELRYLEPDRFALVFDRDQGLVSINERSAQWNYRLNDGDVLQFGAESFVYRLEAVQPDGSSEELDRLRRTVERHRLLTRVIQSLFNADDFRTFCMRAIKAVIRLTELDRAVFFLVEEGAEGDSYLRQICSVTLEDDGKIDETDILRVSQDILGKALHTGSTVIVQDTGEEVDRSRSVLAMDLRSLVCIPITVPRQTLPEDERAYQPAYCLGMIYADSHDPLAELPSDSQEFLSLVASTMSSVILQWQLAAVAAE